MSAELGDLMGQLAALGGGVVLGLLLALRNWILLRNLLGLAGTIALFAGVFTSSSELAIWGGAFVLVAELVLAKHARRQWLEIKRRQAWRGPGE